MHMVLNADMGIGRWRSYSDIELKEAITVSQCMYDVMNKLGLALGGQAIQSVKRYADHLGIDRSHFLTLQQLRVRNGLALRELHRIPDDEVFCKNSIVCQNTVVSHYKEKKEVPYTCVLCGQGSVHNGQPLKLQLDHKNGDSRDHTLDNIRWLCPNCHTQTDTFCRKNLGRSTRLLRKKTNAYGFQRLPK